jgi:hypothetical protein
VGLKVVDRGEDAARRRVQEPCVARRRVHQVRGRRLPGRGGGEQAAVRHHRGRVLHLPPDPAAAGGREMIHESDEQPAQWHAAHLMISSPLVF